MPELTTWGFSHFDVEDSAAVLDIGCRGRKGAQAIIAAHKEGKAVRHRLFRNVRKSSEAGKRKRMWQAEKWRSFTGAYPIFRFKDGMFDLVTTVESYYFWPDLAHDFREVRRVMKPGGIFRDRRGDVQS